MLPADDLATAWEFVLRSGPPAERNAAFDARGAHVMLALKWPCLWLQRIIVGG